MIFPDVAIGYVFEKIDLGIDNERLADDLLSAIGERSPIMQSESFGGWSVQSHSGRWDDGWQIGHSCFIKEGNTVRFNYERAYELGVQHEWNHREKTDICSGYASEVMDLIDSMGLHPRRARVSLLRAGGQSQLHRDGMPHQYMARLHIPLITNESCTFWCEQGEDHMAADGHAYIIWVNVMHQIFNRSDQDRYHLIMNIWDSNWITENFRCPDHILNDVVEDSVRYDRMISDVRNRETPP